MATASLLIHKRKMDTVISGGTKVVDTVPLVKFRTLEYAINFSNSSNSIKRSTKLFVQDDACKIVFGRLGGMDLNIDTSINGSNLELSVTNNEGYDVSVKLTRTIN